jgi:hypothetical protein
MKTLALSIVFAVGLSAPTFAQTGHSLASPNPPADASADVIDESLILEATTLEDRAAMLRRCAGPPPKAMIASDKPKQTPVSEPVVVAEKAAGGSHSGGGD